MSSEYPGRETFLKGLIAKMSGSDQLPSIEEIERVWFELLREVREQGEVSRFSAQVATPSGELSQRDVVRVGAFNIVDTNGNYLSFNIDKLSELPRQPGGGFNAQAQDLAGSQSGLTQFGIDPTGLLVDRSSLRSLIAPRSPSAGIRVAMLATRLRR